MNEKYAICFEYGKNNIKELEAFIHALNNLDKLKEECKGKVEYFFGMRKNWFPLVLLRAAKVGNTQALNMFNQMVQDKHSHSIFYKEHATAFVDPCCTINMAK